MLCQTIALLAQLEYWYNMGLFATKFIQNSPCKKCVLWGTYSVVWSCFRSYNWFSIIAVIFCIKFEFEIIGIQQLMLQEYELLETLWCCPFSCKILALDSWYLPNEGKIWGIFFNSLRPIQNGRHFPNDIFKWIFFNENIWIFIKISMKFVPKGLINNIPALVQIMAWRRPGDKPLSEPMMISLLTHKCVTPPQWVNSK